MSNRITRKYLEKLTERAELATGIVMELDLATHYGGYQVTTHHGSRPLNTQRLGAQGMEAFLLGMIAAVDYAPVKEKA